MTKTFDTLDYDKKGDAVIRFGSLIHRAAIAPPGSKMSRTADAASKRLGYFICGIARAPHDDVYRERLWYLTHDLGGRYPVYG